MPADTLPAALARHAAATPHDPWLFEPRGWDWRWHSFAAVAAFVERGAAALGALPPATRVGFRAHPRPEAIALDLAIQAAGLVSVPLQPDLDGEALAVALAARGCDVWALMEDEAGETSPPAPLPPALSDPRERGVKTFRVVSTFRNGPLPPLPAGGRATGEGGRGGEVFPGVSSGGGGVMVMPRDGAPRLLSQEDLAAQAERLRERLGTGAERDVVVLGRPLEEPAERAMLAWATATGAAVLLEPVASSRAATAVWARPTVFHGSAAELAVLARAAGRARRSVVGRRPRLPFGRLRVIVAAGPLPPEEAGFWEARGVEVLAPGALG